MWLNKDNPSFTAMKAKLAKLLMCEVLFFISE